MATEPQGICEWVWEQTGNEVLAGLADWLIGRPLSALVIVIIAWIVAKIARRVVRKAIVKLVIVDRDAASRALQKVGMASGAVTVEDPRRTARASSIAAVVTSTVTVAIWVIATLLVLGEIGVDLAPLIAGAGIAGVALGFGAQNLVKDCVSGLFMLIEDQYGIGDSVDLGVASGAVEKITLRTTVARGQDGTLWHVPNGEIRRVGNRSKLYSVAVLDVHVAYDADLVMTRRVVHDVAQEVCESEDYAGDVLSSPDLLGVEEVTARRGHAAVAREDRTGHAVPAAAGAARGDQGRSRRGGGRRAPAAPGDVKSRHPTPLARCAVEDVPH